MRQIPNPDVLKWLQGHEESCFLSLITMGEIERGIELLPSGSKKKRLRAGYEDLLESLEGHILGFDLAVSRRWAVLTASWQVRDRRLPVLDSLIEATALHRDMTVVTRNASDFVEATVFSSWEKT